MLSLLLLQAAAQPDIQLGVRMVAEQVSIEKDGEASLTVSSTPEGRNLVDVRAPDGNGRRVLRDVDVSVRAEARIADPISGQQETPPAPPR